jgi:hypothetical protein
MFEFLFKDIYASITTFVVIGLMTYSLALFGWFKPKHWGRSILLFIVFGILVSAISAMRDGYASPQALFSMNSVQALLCSIAGIAILLIGVLTIFIKNQNNRRICFLLISLLFILQVVVIEGSRILIGMGG